MQHSQVGLLTHNIMVFKVTGLPMTTAKKGPQGPSTAVSRVSKMDISFVVYTQIIP